MGYTLPKSVDIDGQSYEIRYDFRVILEIFEAINDVNLSDQDRAFAALQMFYVDFCKISDYDAALEQLFTFIRGGREAKSAQKEPKLVDWEQDFPIIAAPVNRVLGFDIRGVVYDIEHNTGGLHWFTFLSAYMEIGDCLFSQVVSIRDKKARGKPLAKTDREFYRKNRELIDFETNYTDAEKVFLEQWTGEKENRP